MRVAIGLSIATGLPWQYWADQDDEVVATALDILERARSSKKRPTDDADSAMMSG